METNCKKVIIDCDPGVDDAFALAYALMQKDIEILGITTVNGNMPVNKTSRNALIIRDLFGSSTPVFAGEENSLTDRIPLSSTEKYHGEDGLGDIGLKPSANKVEKEKAADFILDTIRMEETQSVDIICLGPLTNIAAAINKDPECMKRTLSIYSMGGSVLCGNVTPVAEFNYWMDPKAAKIVYDSGIDVHMVSLNLCNGVILPDKIRNRMKNGEPEIRLLEEMLNNWKNNFPLYDLITMIASLSPDIVKWLHCSVDISTTKVTRGECLADLVDAWKNKKNCFYAVEIDEQSLWELFCNTFLPV